MMLVLFAESGATSHLVFDILATRNADLRDAIIDVDSHVPAGATAAHAAAVHTKAIALLGKAQAQARAANSSNPNGKGFLLTEPEMGLVQVQWMDRA